MPEEQKLTETTNLQNTKYRTRVPGEIKREEISGTIERVTVRVGDLEIKPRLEGGHEFLLNGVSMHPVIGMKLEWDQDRLFTIEFTRRLDYAELPNLHQQS